MRPIQHYVFALISFLLLWWIAGFPAVFWVVVGFCTYLLVKNLMGTMVWAIIGTTILSSVLLFQNFGWVTALGFVILLFGYGYLRETDAERWHRLAGKSRASLIQLVRDNIEGRLTNEQLDVRAQLSLRDELTAQTFYIPNLSKLFLSEEGMKPNEYRAYLELIERHLSKVERVSPFSDLHQAVRAKLGLNPNR